MPEIDVREAPVARLAEYARIPIAFGGDRVLDVVAGDDGTVDLVERSVAPFVKDYDALEPPTAWPARFDLSRWAMLTAHVGGAHVGGAVVAFDTPGVDMLGGARDRAVLWDLRVAPAWRGRGVGRRLFEAAVAWARARACRALIVETQNVNVAACRFYARMGCTLHAVHPRAYPALPHETQLIWRRALADERA